MYGFAAVAGQEVCFYEDIGISRSPTGLVRVWTKCLSLEEMDAIDIKRAFDGRILETTARKVARYYVPPIAAVEDLDVDQAMRITTYEEIANISYLRPHLTIYYELDCTKIMMRELSFDMAINDRFGSEHKPRDWHYVPPQTNPASLMEILCRK